MNSPIVNEWVKKAEEDLKACRILSQKELAEVTDVVCFHAQQCAEKYLKAFLNSKEQEAPKIHSLKILIELIEPLDPEFRTLFEDASQLEEYAVEFRYPGETAIEEEARDALRRMVIIRDFIRKKLGFK
ncbi:MAG: HEPN domain-containing protein [Deltaproteobacteria bacterium]|nr:HEPN domain-containing protein [Deltaproteobacteria bacterium]